MWHKRTLPLLTDGGTLNENSITNRLQEHEHHSGGPQYVHGQVQHLPSFNRGEAAPADDEPPVDPGSSHEIAEQGQVEAERCRPVRREPEFADPR